MAAHIFCPSCGVKNEFSNGRRPNFCSGCGYNFSSLAAFGGDRTIVPQRQATNTGPALDIDYTNEGDSSGRRGAQSTELDIDVVGDGSKVVRDPKTGTFRAVDTNRAKVGDFFAHPMPPEEARHPMNVQVKAAKKQVKEAFDIYKGEAGGNGLKRVEIGQSTNIGEAYNE